MKAFGSITAGTLLLERDVKDAPRRTWMIASGSHDLRWQDAHALSTVHDWNPFEASTEEEIISQFTKEYWRCSTRRLIESLFIGLTDSLMREVLIVVEDLLQSRVSAEAILDDVLKAPLARCHIAERARDIAFSEGLTAIATVIEEVLRLQPLISRFAALWLSLAPSAFESISRTPQVLWCLLGSEGALRPLITAASADIFRKRWSPFALKALLPSERVALQKLGNRLAESLHSGDGEAAKSLLHMDDESNEDELPESHEYKRDSKSAFARFNNVKCQIEGIAQAIGKGDDTNAKRYLRELVGLQVRRSEVSFAVKSLCNIAKQCADMFRMDFERECLDVALQLQPSDVRTLLQLADHDKRQGRFSSAEMYINTALPFTTGDDVLIAKSLMADVLSSRGRFGDAIDAYKKIDGWEADSRIRTAIADNLRLLGDFSSARKLFAEILQENPSAIRPQIGVAELAKVEGNLQESLERYQQILNNYELSALDRRICLVSTATVLKRMERYADAFQFVDKAVKAAPFDLGARIQRGAIFGLLNNATAGLNSLRGEGSLWQKSHFDEWRRYYVQGLLLLQSGQFDEASRVLNDRWKAANDLGEPVECLRLASAVAFLSKNDPAEAKRVLSDGNAGVDTHLRYIRHILELHVAIALGGGPNVCPESLCRAVETEPIFRAAVTRLLNRDTEAALEFEIRLLLAA